MFADECGSTLKTTVVKTWASTGETPTIQSKLNWQSVSIIAGLSSAGHLLQRTYEHSIKAPQVVEFLEHVLAHIPGDVIVVLDRAKVHRAKLVKASVDTQPRLTLEYLPGDAPECNLVAWFWASIKCHVLGNVCFRNIRELNMRWR
ncbi:transposase (plasmid) [Deinococcus sp. KNUC1210]|uniref:transposase n=1 Tax=Deinococcus sp. KNUC1210 TaxID=2917691 RepID=UPI001EF02DFF|nr:transposase [Deinococcus sp. KNUC1210]ULH18360.1 transposase [Deinococcus sp. KNUC1210]